MPSSTILLLIYRFTYIVTYVSIYFIEKIQNPFFSFPIIKSCNIKGMSFLQVEVYYIYAVFRNYPLILFIIFLISYLKDPRKIINGFYLIPLSVFPSFCVIISRIQVVMSYAIL